MNPTKLQNLLTFLGFLILFSFDIYLILLQGLRGFAAFSFPIIPVYGLGVMTVCYFVTKQLKKVNYDWRLFSQITLGLSFVLFAYLLWLTISNYDNPYGREKALWKSMSWRSWAGPETHYFFEPFVGWFGLIISIFTYFRFRLFKAETIIWKIGFWLPQFFFVLLLLAHFVFIKKPIFYG